MDNFHVNVNMFNVILVPEVSELSQHFLDYTCGLCWGNKLNKDAQETLLFRALQKCIAQSFPQKVSLCYVLALVIYSSPSHSIAAIWHFLHNISSTSIRYLCFLPLFPNKCCLFLQIGYCWFILIYFHRVLRNKYQQFLVLINLSTNSVYWAADVA